ncbi:HAMP domain-containing histidine kinase [Lichenicola cladoniae]|uniref:histidine kinase n=1 Tax=Lichenicola cladoniae TaxID=1484109 RepID=A0A6M8HME2_9PROT|nr:HAMP domain-containing sensor histidine kinase [Lichenicola cladoniae]NPD66943.1 HAMP domain-containing histidine kinase [Acetobacteraceae bacterium]QKE89497.1 HAMP domain-containing histidine kinase [Lichenicola cladoniae]
MRRYLPEMFSTAAFRLALGSSVILAGVTVLQFSLIYWRTTAYEVERADRLLDREAALMAAQTPADLREQMRLWQTNDLRLLITAAGLFDADRKAIAGNLTTWPETLPVDGGIREITVHPSDQGERLIRAEALPVPGGRILVIGRGLRDLQQIRSIVLQALETCLIPALAFSLLAGIWLSRRGLVRVGRMQLAIDRIMEGGLHERLPVRTGPGRDEMERLAVSVNRMLDRLERLLDEIKGVGDDIAHDLRTPLARVRAGLDRTRLRPQQPRELEAGIDRAIIDLDQCFAIITALLRIGEIDNGRRRGGFVPLDLHQIAIDIVELYEPLAEAAGNRLVLEPGDSVPLVGDRDLLIELAANLVDNAIKFTPSGGTVSVSTHSGRDGPVLRVADTGVGIAEKEQQAVLARFYRSDKSRHIPGSGLGLSLVAAIVRLHSARILVSDATRGGDCAGAVFEVIFPRLAADVPI